MAEQVTDIRGRMADLAAEKMEHVWGKEPVQFPMTKRMALGNGTVRDHAPGVVSLQCGRGVSYVFDLNSQGAKEMYDKMLAEAKRGELEGIELLIGKIEFHEYSEMKDNTAYIVTMAFSRSEWWAEYIKRKEGG